MNMRTSSISPASRNTPARCGPPSSSSDWISRDPSSSSASRTRAASFSPVAHDHLHARVARAHRWPCAWRRASTRRSPGTSAALRTSCESERAGSPPSRTPPGAGWLETPSIRAVSSGSSWLAVWMPTATASHSARQRWARARLDSPGDPLRVAGAGGDLAVEGHRRLEHHERPPGAGVLAERLVEQARGLRDRRRRTCRRRSPRRAGSPGRGPRPSRSGSSEATTTRRSRPRRSRPCRAASGPRGSRARATRTSWRRRDPPRRRRARRARRAARPPGRGIPRRSCGRPSRSRRPRADSGRCARAPWRPARWPAVRWR